MVTGSFVFEYKTVYVVPYMRRTTCFISNDLIRNEFSFLANTFQRTIRSSPSLCRRPSKVIMADWHSLKTLVANAGMSAYISLPSVKLSTRCG
jgi:hypothetical protein